MFDGGFYGAGFAFAMLLDENHAGFGLGYLGGSVGGVAVYD